MDTESIPHFICVGECMAVSTTPGVCQAPTEGHPGGCSESGKTLAECNCEDIHNHDPIEGLMDEDDE